jgi:hypothetical protein
MAETNETSSINRERIAKTVTIYVLIITSLILVGGVVILLARSGKEDTSFSQYKDIVGMLLPLLGTWIGAVLAYYFSKDNFESANKSVRQIVDKITSQQKLESVKAKDVMIEKSKLIAQTLAEGEDLSKFKLKEDCIEFVEKNKIKRVIILDEKDQAKYVIHRDLISYFLAGQALAGKSVENCTLKDMYENGGEEIKNTLENSVRFLREDANLLEAKKLMEQTKTCQDVFITKSGGSVEPILGWITNVTIEQNSIV